MELSSSNIKKFLIYSRKKVFLLFWETETPKKLFIFQETELSRKKPTLKKCLIFREMKLSNPKLNFLYFKRNLESLKIKNFTFFV